MGGPLGGYSGMGARVLTLADAAMSSGCSVTAVCPRLPTIAWWMGKSSEEKAQCASSGMVSILLTRSLNGEEQRLVATSQSMMVMDSVVTAPSSSSACRW